jgi:hypothetical protein
MHTDKGTKLLFCEKCQYYYYCYSYIVPWGYNANQEISPNKLEKSHLQIPQLLLCFLKRDILSHPTFYVYLPTLKQIIYIEHPETDNN